MVATIRAFDDADLPRVAQLIGKTNQFNVTSRRHDLGALQEMMRDDDVVHLSLRLRDRFADHGLVGSRSRAATATVLDIDTWLMSCRVIGRTAERAVLGALAHAARAAGCDELRGTYVPSAKNGLVRDLFPSLGFVLDEEQDGTTVWRRAVDDDALVGSTFIDVIAEDQRGAA